MTRIRKEPPRPDAARRSILLAAAAFGLAPAPGHALQAPYAELQAWLAQHLPETVADLNPGATDAQLDRLSSRIGVALPDDYRALYRWHNGQKDKKFVTGPWYGLTFLSLDRVEDEWRSWVDIVDTMDMVEMSEFSESVPPGVVKPLYANKLWVPFAHDGGGNFLGIDLDPDVKGVRGQVINFGRDEERKQAIAPSVHAFVQWMLAELGAGNFSITTDREGDRVFDMPRPPSTGLLDAAWRMFR